MSDEEPQKNLSELAGFFTEIITGMSDAKMESDVAGGVSFEDTVKLESPSVDLFDEPTFAKHFTELPESKEILDDLWDVPAPKGSESFKWPELREVEVDSGTSPFAPLQSKVSDPPLNLPQETTTDASPFPEFKGFQESKAPTLSIPTVDAVDELSLPTERKQDQFAELADMQGPGSEPISPITFPEQEKTGQAFPDVQGQRIDEPQLPTFTETTSGDSFGAIAGQEAPESLPITLDLTPETFQALPTPTAQVTPEAKVPNLSEPQLGSLAIDAPVAEVRDEAFQPSQFQPTVHEALSVPDSTFEAGGDSFDAPSIPSLPEARLSPTVPFEAVEDVAFEATWLSPAKSDAFNAPESEEPLDFTPPEFASPDEVERAFTVPQRGIEPVDIPTLTIQSEPIAHDAPLRDLNPQATTQPELAVPSELNDASFVELPKPATKDIPTVSLPAQPIAFSDEAVDIPMIPGLPPEVNPRRGSQPQPFVAEDEFTDVPAPVGLGAEFQKQDDGVEDQRLEALQEYFELQHTMRTKEVQIIQMAVAQLRNDYERLEAIDASFERSRH